MMLEKAYVLGRDRSMLGIVSRPPDGRAKAAHDAFGVVLMNAGVVHRVGPNRLNVNLARRLADSGHTCLRFDLSGFGDSGPRRDNLPFEAAAAADLVEAMDFFADTTGLRRFVLVGVCSGADLSLRVAATDARVAGAAMIDSFAFSTLLYRAQSYGQRMLDPESWENLVTGRSELWATVRRRLPLARRAPEVSDEEGTDIPDWVMPPKTEILADVRGAVGRGVPLYFVYSGGPAYYNYLTHFRGSFAPLVASRKIHVEVFREADHTFTLSYNQRALIDGIERWVAGLACPNPSHRRT